MHKIEQMPVTYLGSQLRIPPRTRNIFGFSAPSHIMYMCVSIEAYILDDVFLFFIYIYIYIYIYNIFIYLIPARGPQTMLLYNFCCAIKL